MAQKEQVTLSSYKLQLHWRLSTTADPRAAAHRGELLNDRAVRMLLHALATPLLLHAAPRRMGAEPCMAERPPPSLAECLEASFVPAVMGVARGDVTELKLFIAAVKHIANLHNHSVSSNPSSAVSVVQISQLQDS